MYRFAKNGREATLADLVFIAKQSPELCFTDNNDDIPGSKNIPFELVYTPNIYKKRRSEIENVSIVIPSDENIYSPGRPIRFKEFVGDISVRYYNAIPDGDNEWYFDYKTLANNLLLPGFTYKNNAITYLDVSNITGTLYGPNDPVKLADIFLEKHLCGLEIVSAVQDESTALEAYYTGNINITWSGMVRIIYENGDTSLMPVYNHPYVLKGIKSLGTIIWPNIGIDLDTSKAYDICQYDLTMLGTKNNGIELLSDASIAEYGLTYDPDSLKQEIIIPSDCKRDFDEYVFTDAYGRSNKTESNQKSDAVTTIKNVLHLLRKPNYITGSTYYNLLLHLEVYLGGVNYNIYPTMGYGQKIGDTTNQSNQNKRLIPWQGETVYLLTYFSYTGDTYKYASNSFRNVLFNDMSNYEFNILYYYIQNLTDVHFYATLSGNAISYSNVNTASIQIPLNEQNVERTLTISVVYTGNDVEYIEQGKTTSIEFRQEANPRITEDETKVIVYSICSESNPNAASGMGEAGYSTWDWSARLRITMIDPSKTYSDGNYGAKSVASMNPYAMTLEQAIENENMDKTSGDMIYAMEDSEYLAMLNGYEIKTFYVSANTTSENTKHYPAKYLCGTLKKENPGNPPPQLRFYIELNALTFSAIENSYYFSYFTVQGDQYSKMWFHDKEFPNEEETEQGIEPESLTVGESLDYIDLSYDTSLGGYKLYIRPIYRPFKYTLNVAFQDNIDSQDPYYYIIKFKFKYKEEDEIYDAQNYQLVHTNLLKNDNEENSIYTEIRTRAGMPTSGARTREEENENTENDDQEKIFEIASFMPIDVDRKVYFPIETDDDGNITYKYMFISKSTDLKEFKGIPIYGIYNNDALSYRYQDFIPLPQEIEIEVEFEILWYIKGTTEQITKDTFQYNDSIQYSFDNITYTTISNIEQENKKVSNLIKLQYYNKASTEVDQAIDNITLYIRNDGTPSKKISSDKS